MWLLKMYTYVNRAIRRVPQANLAEITTHLQLLSCYASVHCHLDRCDAAA